MIILKKTIQQRSGKKHKKQHTHSNNNRFHLFRNLMFRNAWNYSLIGSIVFVQLMKETMPTERAMSNARIIYRPILMVYTLYKVMRYHSVNKLQVHIGIIFIISIYNEAKERKTRRVKKSNHAHTHRRHEVECTIYLVRVRSCIYIRWCCVLYLEICFNTLAMYFLDWRIFMRNTLDGTRNKKEHTATTT